MVIITYHEIFIEYVKVQYCDKITSNIYLRITNTENTWLT